MRIADVEILHFEGGIIFADRESVVQALRLYKQGIKDREELARPYGDIRAIAGVSAFAFSARAHKSRSPIDGKMMHKLKTQIGAITAGQVYDWEFKGLSFRPDYNPRISVSAVPVSVEEAVYLLKFYSPVTGNQTQEKLARALKAPRSLENCEVRLKVYPEGKRFEFDFDVIAAALRSAGIDSLSGDRIASLVIERNKQWQDKSYIAIEIPHRDLVVKIAINARLSMVRKPRDEQTRRMLWKQQGAVLSGPVANLGYTTDAYRYPEFGIGISHSSERPIVNDDMKLAVNSLAQSVHDALINNL